MDDLQENEGYYIALGQDILLGLRIDLCFSDYAIRENVGAYENCKTPMKDVNKGKKKTPTK